VNSGDGCLLLGSGCYQTVMTFIGVTKFLVFLVTHRIYDLSVDFRWKRVHLFEQLSCQVLYDKCMEQPLAKIENVQSKPKSKWRPLPLDTVVSARNF
jgi:DNA topoisomerase-3